MLFFLVSLLSFLLLLTKPLSLHLPSWVNEMRLLSALLCQEFLSHSIEWLKNYKLVGTQILKLSSTVLLTSENNRLRIENVKEAEAEGSAEAKMNMLDLPELALDLILDKLPPDGLLNMANVCTCLRDRCRSDHLWERHLREKWGGVIGKIARREWETRLFDSTKERKGNKVVRGNWILESLYGAWPCSWFASREESGAEMKKRLQVDSVMALYLALESGRFWFPAQVYNRENAHVGFLLSCYDAELAYDSHSDTFHARYPQHGRRGINAEEGVRWDRLRAPPVDTRAHDLHTSDCLDDLRPGDHIEIQWRRNKEFPYGWWYGVVGHLESCDGEEHHCRCYDSDSVVLEFNQYSPGSRWRRTVVDRKDHREEGNGSDGFYGGIRKLYNENEISVWRKFWPTDVLE